MEVESELGKGTCVILVLKEGLCASTQWEEGGTRFRLYRRNGARGAPFFAIRSNGAPARFERAAPALGERCSVPELRRRAFDIVALIVRLAPSLQGRPGRIKSGMRPKTHRGDS